MTDFPIVYTMPSSKDEEKQPLPSADVIQVNIPQSEHQQTGIRWGWCHVVTSVFGYFCCQPFGLISLVMVVLAYSDHKAKDFIRSEHKRKVALGFGIAAIIIGSLLTIAILTTYLYYCVYYSVQEDMGVPYGRDYIEPVYETVKTDPTYVDNGGIIFN